MLESLYLNLGQHDALSENEKALLAATMSVEKDFGTGQDIVSEGSRPTYSTLILDGLAARYKVLDDGGRQFTSLQVPGDFVDLHAFLLKTMDHGIIALSPCRVIVAEHVKLPLGLWPRTLREARTEGYATSLSQPHTPVSM